MHVHSLDMATHAYFDPPTNRAFGRWRRAGWRRRRRMHGRTRAERFVHGSERALDGVICGALDPASDQDWFTWSVASANVAYDVTLTATGDAELLMWQLVGNRYTTHRRHVAARQGEAWQFDLLLCSGGVGQQ